MENIRSSNVMLQQVQQLGLTSGQEILKLASADTEDAIEVLEGGHIIANPEALKLLKQGLLAEQQALNSLLPITRNNSLDQAITLKQQAMASLLTAPPTKI